MKQHNLILKRHFDIFFSNALLIYIFSLLVTFQLIKTYIHLLVPLYSLMFGVSIKKLIYNMFLFMKGV